MLIWYFGFTIFMFLIHIYNFKYVFNSTVIKLSWHVFCYLISKNLYSLQNVQPFIFQVICIQLCKCINCFLKPHNKQLNQYFLNFTIFFYSKKKFKKMVRFGSRVGSVWPAKNMSRVTSQPVFTLGQKIGFESDIFRVGSENSDLFCHDSYNHSTRQTKKNKITTFFFLLNFSTVRVKFLPNFMQ